MGKHGLSCDNVVSADLVDAEGNHLTVSATENEDLFWAIRGGGGNFGIVTALEFRLHDLSRVQGGVLLYPRPLAVDLLRQYRDLTQRAPDELTAYAALLVGHGHPMAAVALCHSGDGGAVACGKFHLSTPPAVDMTGEKKYTEVQTMLDFTAPAGLHYYFKCRFLRELTDEAIGRLSTTPKQCDRTDAGDYRAHAWRREPRGSGADGVRIEAGALQREYHSRVGGPRYD